MSKARTITGVFSVIRRCLSSAAGEVEIGLKPSVSAIAGMKTESETSQKCYWMRDPQTGYWIPENRFGDVDAAELRAKLLLKKRVLTTES